MDNPQESRLRNARIAIRQARDLLEAEYVDRDDAESVLGDIAEDLGDILVRLEGIMAEPADEIGSCRTSTREI